MNEMNIISNALFQNFHTDSSGAVFTWNNLKLSVESCQFQYCTADDTAACFLAISSTIEIHKTCFYHTQIVKKVDGSYGNAFFIKNSQSAQYDQISAYLCGYSVEEIGDSTFVTSSTPLKGNAINASYCASFYGSCSLAFDNGPSSDSVKYLTCVSPWSISSLSYFLVLYGRSKSTVDNFNMINGSMVYTMFWLSEWAFLTINNGIFIDPKPESFVNSNRLGSMKLNNCFSTKELPISSGVEVTQEISQQGSVLIADMCYIVSPAAKTCPSSTRYHFYHLFYHVILFSF